MIKQDLTDRNVTNFLDKICKTETCWFWVGMIDRRGFGIFKTNSGNKAYKAHRISLLLRDDYIEDGLRLYHTCGNNHCVNPDHLTEQRPVVNKIKRIPLTATKRAEICERYKRGESSVDLSDLYGVHNSTITTIIKKVGIGIRSKQENHPQKLTKIIQLQVHTAYKDGLDPRNIAKKFDVSEATIRNTLRRNEIKTRTLKEATIKHTLDATVFDILTEESAYWIGMLMADGFIIQRKGNSLNVGLGLQLSDIEHIEKFKRFLKTDYRINIRPDKNFAEFRVVSDQLGNALGRYGVVPRKCKITKAVPELENNRHFWRGLVDGDGHVGTSWIRKTTEMPEISLCGSIDLITQFHAYIKRLVPTYKGSIRPHHGSFTVMINGQGAITVIKELYGDCETYLDRKYETAQYIIENAETLMPGKARGSRVGTSKLTEDVVKSIKRIRRDTGLGYRRIAKQLDMPAGTVDGIIRGRSWQHVTI